MENETKVPTHYTVAEIIALMKARGFRPLTRQQIHRLAQTSTRTRQKWNVLPIITGKGHPALAYSRADVEKWLAGYKPIKWLENYLTPEGKEHQE